MACALELSRQGHVGILSKGPESATKRAQGGIAAVLSSNDSIEQHAQDTLRTGAGLCDPHVVEAVVSKSHACIQWLQQLGVRFTTQQSGSLHLSQEGGHSIRRVAHFKDETGREINRALGQLVHTSDRIRVLKHSIAIDLLTQEDAGSTRCVGANTLNPQTGLYERFYASVVILATGGASKIYPYSTNPEGAHGDGMAMAWRAGCTLANLEFQQFHPTCLYHQKDRNLLLTEALRGEGALLRLPDGSEFLSRHQATELSPRDIIARAIHSEMVQKKLDFVLLDLRPLGSDRIKNLFPAIYHRCLQLGLDLTQTPAPVVPAAHYSCGGIQTDLHGCTELKSLYAIGETTCTGLHGANRMASNSLLECLVFAQETAKHIRISNSGFKPDLMPVVTPDNTPLRQTVTQEEYTRCWQDIRDIMWQYAGLVRSDASLTQASSLLKQKQEQIRQWLTASALTVPLAELRNMVQVAQLTIDCALQRKESRGLHYNKDHPNQLTEAVNSYTRTTDFSDPVLPG